MLLRFVVKNYYSFKEQTEFNLFPSSRATYSKHHIISCAHAEVMRFSSIYGANGAGKSNFIKALADLQLIVARGSINGLVYAPYKFQLAKENLDEPVSLAIEFYSHGKVYYYSLDLDTGRVINEALYVSEKSKDRPVFERRGNGSQSVSFGKEYLKDEKSQIFSNVLEEKLLNKEALLLSFMAVNYQDENQDIKNAYDWLLRSLFIVRSDSMKNFTIPHLLDTNPEVMSLLMSLLPGMKTGISNMVVVPSVVSEDMIGEGLANNIKSTPGRAWTFPSRVDSRINDTIVFENGQLIRKELQPFHRLSDGTEVKMPISFESDGTIRLIEYVPVIYFILNQDCTVVIDEIERSLHPILIKEIITKLSESKTAKGQIIFTTHESCLLDKEVLRPDEIWFAQKDQEQATQLYPLSDFNIHKTANIENGYLNGRYGGIPFLSNLKDLHW